MYARLAVTPPISSSCSYFVIWCREINVRRIPVAANRSVYVIIELREISAIVLLHLHDLAVHRTEIQIVTVLMPYSDLYCPTKSNSY